MELYTEQILVSHLTNQCLYVTLLVTVTEAFSGNICFTLQRKLLLSNRDSNIKGENFLEHRKILSGLCSFALLFYSL